MESMQKQFDSSFRDLLIDACLCPEVTIAGPKRDEVGPTLLVGVSGGVDSMSLLHLLTHSSVETKIIVAHCNFHLRGEESDGDAAFVQEFCKAKGLGLCVSDCDTVRYAQERGLSIETAARELRYGCFVQLCGEFGCNAVVVAHNANDNAETLFLNLLRGTGLRGLCGMRPLSYVPVENTGILLLRPLLGFTRDQIEVYARANNIHWREDSTNAANDCHRNIIRNEVFPLLADINPSFIRTLNREMRFFTDANDLVEAVVPDIIRNGKINIGELLSYAPWRIILFNLLRPFNFNSAVIDDIAEHIISDIPNHIFLSPTHRLQITSKNLIITERSKTESPDTYIYKEGTYKIEGGTLMEITGEPVDTGETAAKPSGGAGEGRTIDIEVIPREGISDLKAPRGTTYLDADKVRFPFMLRGWRHGDWFRPLGMGGAKKKVSDLFVDLKYNIRDKENALFLTLPYDSKSHICALLGERIDDTVKVDSSTTRILKIIIQ